MTHEYILYQPRMVRCYKIHIRLLYLALQGSVYMHLNIIKLLLLSTRRKAFFLFYLPNAQAWVL